ncbi:MAG: aldose epimerase family protein [Bacteroidota bacterium]
MSTLKTAIIANKNGMELHVSNFGATIISLKVPNRDGNLTEVVLGLSSPLDYLKDGYLNENKCLGSSIGRFAGRISGGGFKIDGQFYPLSQKNGQHLHGGFNGFDKRYWKFEDVNKGENPNITLRYVSQHMEEGYPGNLKVSVTYQLLESNELNISYSAKTDKPTHVNLTNHAYFNLNGKGSIVDHLLKINSNKYLEVNDKNIPSGNILNSEETPFDRNEITEVGRSDFKGFDNVFVLSDNEQAAELISNQSGIKMIVKTNQPALVVFTPENLNGFSFKEGVTYNNYTAICFEAQNFPDAPNHANFPSSLLLPGEIYETTTSFRFSLLDSRQ